MDSEIRHDGVGWIMIQHDGDDDSLMREINKADLHCMYDVCS